jgi:hypothetical protein
MLTVSVAMCSRHPATGCVTELPLPSNGSTRYIINDDISELKRRKEGNEGMRIKIQGGRNLPFNLSWFLPQTLIFFTYLTTISESRLHSVG